MSDCRRCQNELSALLDGELGSKDRERVLAHLATCDSCTDEFSSLTAAHNALQELAAPLSSRPVLAPVRARIRQQEQSQRKSFGWAWAAVPGLAGALALAFFLNNSPGPVRQAAVPEANTPEAQVTVSAVPIPPVKVTEKPEVAPKQAAYRARPKSAVLAERPLRRTVRRFVAQPVSVAAVPEPAPALKLAAAPAALPAVEASDQTPEPRSRIVVAAYRPAERFGGQAFDSDSGRRVARWSVSRSYSATGSVDKAEVILHFAPSDPADNNNDTTNTRPEQRSEMDRYMVNLIGRV